MIASMVLSFIIPCYKVEKYIQRCLDSVYACDLDEEQYEVLCVNDASPDNVQGILESVQKKHPNLRIVVHEENKGLGGARNTGIREARGEYLWFVDSDDEIIGNGLSEAVEKAKAEELDVLCFNYCRIDEEGKELSRHRVFGNVEAKDGYGFADSVFGKSFVNHMGYVWRFIYRTDFLRSQQLAFPEKEHWEDTVFMPKSLLLARRIAAVPQVFYSYRVNPDSISGSFSREYSAKSIYDYAFCAGQELLEFSNGIKERRLKEAFCNTAVDRYINGFPIHLFRTSKYERKYFYKMVRDKYEDVELLKQFMKPFPKLLLSPVFGMSLANVISVAYSLKHKKK